MREETTLNRTTTEQRLSSSNCSQLIAIIFQLVKSHLPANAFCSLEAIMVHRLPALKISTQLPCGCQPQLILCPTSAGTQRRL